MKICGKVVTVQVITDGFRFWTRWLSWASIPAFHRCFRSRSPGPAVICALTLRRGKYRLMTVIPPFTSILLSFIISSRYSPRTFADERDPRRTIQFVSGSFEWTFNEGETDFTAVQNYAKLSLGQELTSLNPILPVFETSNILPRRVSAFGKWIPVKKWQEYKIEIMISAFTICLNSSHDCDFSLPAVHISFASIFDNEKYCRFCVIQCTA